MGRRRSPRGEKLQKPNDRRIGIAFRVEARDAIADKGLEGRILTSSSEGRVQMSWQFNVNKISHPEKDYVDLRQIFDMLSKYTSEQIVIKKK